LSSAFKRAYGVSPNTYRATESYPDDALEAL
jgi:AraC-like DNA-binding protein